MKNKQLWLSFALLAVVFGYASFILPSQMLLQILVIGLGIGIPFKMVYSYLIPNQWIFNHHRRIFLILLGTIIPLFTSKGFEYISQFYTLVFYFSLMLLMFGLSYIAEKVEKRYQNRKLADELVPEDERLVIDRGFSVEESGNQQGLLILSAGKLTFVYNRKNIEPKVIDIQAENLSISNFLLSPAGICTRDANFRVMFPRYWMKKIAEQKG